MGNSPSISHNQAESRFETRSGEHLAVVEYEVRGDAWVFTHTFVPEALRGQGIAEALVREALGEAKKSGRRVVAECSYVVAYIKRHPESVG